MRVKSYIAVFLWIILTGCAATYERPTTAYQPLTTSLTASKTEILTAAKLALASEGYQIATVDNEVGILTTSLRDMRLTPLQADCGKTMGIDYLMDNRTATRVGYGIVAGDGKLTIRAIIEGDYRPGGQHGDQNLMLTCISRGGLEKTLIDKIKPLLP